MPHNERAAAAYAALRVYLRPRAGRLEAEDVEDAIQEAWCAAEAAFAQAVKTRHGDRHRERQLPEDYADSGIIPDEVPGVVLQERPPGHPLDDQTPDRLAGVVRPPAPQPPPIDVLRALLLRAEGKTWLEVERAMGHSYPNIIRAIHRRAVYPYGVRGRRKQVDTTTTTPQE